MQNKIVDNVIELNKKDRESVQAFYNTIRELKINNLICAHQSFHSAWLLKCVRANNKISYSQYWNRIFFNKRVQRKMHWPEAARALDLLSPVSHHVQSLLSEFDVNTNNHNLSSRDSVLKWPDKIPDELKASIPVDGHRRDAALERFQLKSSFIVIAPSSQWNTKRWTENGFAELIHLYNKRGFHVYLVGSPSEKVQCENILNLYRSNFAKHATSCEVRSLAGDTDILLLQDIISGAHLVFSNDSGPMHIAAAMDRPVVAMFGPTTLQLGYRPWSDRSIVVQKNLNCRPCGKHGHNSCPIQTHDCMKMITAQEVEKVSLSLS